MFSPEDYKIGRNLDYAMLSRSKPRLPIDYDQHIPTSRPLSSPMLLFDTNNSPSQPSNHDAIAATTSSDSRIKDRPFFASPLPSSHENERDLNPYDGSSPNNYSRPIKSPDRMIDSVLYQKIVSDQMKSSQNKALEEHLREELRQQQENYQISVQESEKQAKIMKEEIEKAVENALSENDKRWEEIVADKSMIIEKLEDRIDEVHMKHENIVDEMKRNMEQQVHEMKEKMSHQIKDLEEKYDQKYHDLERKAKEQCDKYAKSLDQEKQNYHIALVTEYATKEESNKSIYEKKLKKYEKQIIEAEEAYRMKTASIEAQLKASREEILLLRRNFELTELGLQEELGLKDIRLSSLQSRLDEYSDISKAMSEWRSISTELSALCIRTCAKAVDLPEISSAILAPRYSNPRLSRMTKGGWMMAVEDMIGVDIKEEFLLEYNLLRKRALAIDRKQLIRLLKYSKVRLT
jgi:chromosome segregation ATPase